MFPNIRKRVWIYFLIGALLGYEIAVISITERDDIPTYYESPPQEDNTESKIDLHKENRDHRDKDDLDFSNITNIIKFDDLTQHQDDDSVATALRHSVRVLCWVMTSQTNLEKRAKHVKATWGRRCNVLLFMSDTAEPNFPAVGLNVEPGRSHLATKTMKAFEYVYRNHFNDADWFLKADDDTYVILENLRYMLSAHASNEPVYFGHLLQAYMKQGYFSGGAGYVLSKEALGRFATRDSDQCDLTDGPEDAKMGFCMDTLGVRTGNTRDSLDRSRFHALSLSSHLQGLLPDWYKQFDHHSDRKGIETISDYPISFHYVGPNLMYVMEYFVYHASVYGILRGLQQLNPNNNTTSTV